MKIFACILSVYIMVLTAIPCVDKPEDITMQKMEITQNNTDSHQNDVDHCSPFCTCNCCASPVIQLNVLVNFEGFPFLLESYSSELATDFVSCPTKSIWQPPRLS